MSLLETYARSSWTTRKDRILLRATPFKKNTQDSKGSCKEGPNSTSCYRLNLRVGGVATCGLVETHSPLPLFHEQTAYSFAGYGSGAKQLLNLQNVVSDEASPCMRSEFDESQPGPRTFAQKGACPRQTDKRSTSTKTPPHTGWLTSVVEFCLKSWSKQLCSYHLCPGSHADQWGQRT